MCNSVLYFFFFFSSRRRHTRLTCDWSSDVCSSDLPVWGVLEYLSLFVIVLIHEFGHALACRQVGGVANRIVLWPLGGVAFVNPPRRPGAYLWSIAAGPLVNVALIPILAVAGNLVSQSENSLAPTA